MDPHPQMNTYMINENLIEGATVGAAGEKDIRPKIMSPRRMLYEQKFEKFLNGKYLPYLQYEIQEQERFKQDQLDNEKA